MLAGNVLWYGFVRDYEAISYQVTLTFFTSPTPSNTSGTRMHYTICWRVVVYLIKSSIELAINTLSFESIGIKGME